MEPMHESNEVSSEIYGLSRVFTIAHHVSCSHWTIFPEPFSFPDLDASLYTSYPVNFPPKHPSYAMQGISSKDPIFHTP